MSIPQEKTKILVILGPTASGKSALAVKIGRFLNSSKSRFGAGGAEIVSADSRQVYRGMNIGTAKISKKEMRGIPHHLIDVASPHRRFSVHRYERLGQAVIRKVTSRKKFPIIVGGTGLYIDTLLGNAFPEIKPNQALRKKLERETTEALFTILAKLDPVRAATIDKNNRRRLVRAIEIVKTSGKPVPPQKKHDRYETLKIGITVSEKEHDKKIEKRLRNDLRKGLIRETKRLHESGLSFRRLEEFGLEYRIIARYLRGLISKKDLLPFLFREVRRYAKRQRTWFKKDKEIIWIKNYREAEGITKSFLKSKKEPLVDSP